MTDDELDELRDQEDTLLSALDAAIDEEERQTLLSDIEDLQAEIEEREAEQTMYRGMYMMDMLDEDEGSDFDF
jgi:predicted  nucleic acid-binding Zn-ribbon protein